MKNIVGTPALGVNFYRRTGEIDKILDRINADNNLQIAAPRRVGKTSILHYLKDNRIGGHIYVYIDTEELDNEQDFYKKLLKAILKVKEINQSQLLTKLVRAGEKLFGKVKSVTIMGTGIDFNEDREELNYYEEITNFLSSLELEENRKVILLIDEFPQTILNITEGVEVNTKKAVHFLQSNRQLRQLPEIIGKVQFVYTGSVGLNHTVASINASAFVNDLNTIEIDPLNQDEASEMIQDLVSAKSFTMDNQAILYLINKIKWLIPFHVQLAIHELSTQCRGLEKAGIEEIDKAFNQMVASRNNSHFDHYHSRLISQLKDNAFRYADAVMAKTARQGSISKAELYDLAVAFNVTQTYQGVIDLLVYDGYINNNENKGSYQFYSPVLRIWWEKYICK